MTSPHAIPEENISYEEAKAELEKITQTMDAGGLGLDQTIELWRRGEKLIQFCQEQLTAAESTIGGLLSSQEQESKDPNRA